MSRREALLEALAGPQAPPVSPWPAPLGWALALAVLLAVALGAFLLARALGRRGRAGRWRREARGELATLRARLDRAEPAEILAAASVLARRTLLAVAPRERVAALHGEPWLEALDRACGARLFTGGPGRVLASAPYQRRPTLGREELLALLDALGTLIERVGRRGARA